MGSIKDPEGAELAALDQLVDVRGLRVLEVGAGEGRLTFGYAGRAASVLGIEPDEESVRLARATTPPDLVDRVRFEATSVLDLDEPPGSFDLAFLSWSL